MQFSINELRATTGLTQKAFAELYHIPVSTLRKWEQGEASPAPYVISLLARTLPDTSALLEKIEGEDGSIYYYDSNQNAVLDKYGNKIMISESLDGVNRQNLILYLKDLFETFYEIQERFNRDCRYDKEEDIIWS